MTNASFVAAAPINAQAAAVSAPVNNPLATLFRPKSDADAVKDSAQVLTLGVVKAIAEADKLIAGYGTLKVNVLNHSDRARWAYLQEVYTFVCAVTSSTLEEDTRNEMIRQIRLRGGPNTSSSASTAAIVVRYIFADTSRQTWSNYTIAMEKAAKLRVTPDTFAAFLEQYGGVSKVVEHVFDHEAESQASNAETTKLLREEKKSRTALIGRLYNAMAHKATAQLEYSGEPSNWVPKNPKKAEKSAGKDEKIDPKYEKGNFVFFVTVRDPQAGNYRVVQGNVFDRVYEEELLGAIAERTGAGTAELEQAVVGLEQSIGFKAAE